MKRPADAPPGFDIAPAGPGDLGYVLRAHGLIYAAEHGFNLDFDRYVLLGLAEWARSDSEASRIWTARVGGVPAGSIAIVDAGNGRAQLRWFLVEPAHRGLGLGKALLETALKFARKAGFRIVFLWTLSCLPAARALYAGAGFDLRERREGLIWGRRLTEELFEKKLGPAGDCAEDEYASDGQRG